MSYQRFCRTPGFAEPTDVEAAWFARRSAIEHVLAAVAESPWSEYLVLRGSAVLRAWFGELAREPGDLDFVLTVHQHRLHEDPREIIDDIRWHAVNISRRSGSPVRIGLRSVETEWLWSYYNGSGIRLVLPWHGFGQVGTVRLDFAFDEVLPDPPVSTEFPLSGAGGRSVTLRTTSRRLSLAWKVLWLLAERDSGPRAKDLYDAVLLAEHCHLPPALLDEVLAQGAIDRTTRRELSSRKLLRLALDVDWREFAGEDPLLSGAHLEFAWRLAFGLEPTVPRIEVGAQTPDPAQHG
ncbi:nucleotidyl transferase AbiEii/AbiGii toxin family protein [Nocardia arthritidis]|uniref:nucleotidyl transferase AbiEii/AbiGii toxin family protein n=1 Tax=Nocardia arthritidis TaxID=228602 RepID=UPI00142DD796|nr:nucleotidyl transferase AbiEii/AbiGii toxin family protein [Nocardia arthritidis]